MPRPPATSDPTGAMKLGRYQCTDQIGGSGGFETYRARVRGLAGDRSFAVKVLRLKRSEVPAAVSEPFLQNARRSAMLTETRIARVVEADSGEGLVFAVTPFMEGADLAQVLQLAREAGVLATGKGEAASRWHSLVAYIGAEIARGLQAAHALEPPFIHGGLCPGNVFITSRGAVRLLDFGLRASIRRPFEPRPRRLVPFIAPELAAPAADCTAAGDMYSLGVLLCELSIGELPPQGRRPFELQIALSQLPENLGLLIGRLVSASPAARPAAAEVVSSLAAVYADTAEAALVADLSSLIQHAPTDAPDESSEFTVSLDDAADGADDAPPPPSEVEHDDAYGFEEPLHPRSSEPSGPPPAGQPANRSAPLPSLYGELGSSREVTTVGEPALIDDLVAQSRPAAPAPSTNVARTRPRPPPPPAPRAAPPVIVPLAAPASANREGSLTMIGFGPTGTAALSSPPTVADAAPESSSVAAGGWALPDPPALEMSSNAAPAPASSAWEEEPSVMQDAGEVVLPSVPSFDAPPATWGARALAALGGQAGIGSSPGSQATGLGLLDDVQVEPADPDPPDFAPVRASSGLGGLRDSRPFALDEAPAGVPALAEDYPLEGEPGAQDSEDDAPAADLEARRGAEPPRGDALLEDELVDSSDGARTISPWPPVRASETYALPGQASGGVDGQPFPEAVTLLDDQSESVAEAVAFEEYNTQATPEAETYLDDAEKPAAAAFFDDSGQPLPESEIAALPEVAAPRTPRPLPPAPPSSSGELGHGGVVRRPAQEQASVPVWAKSPEVQKAKHGNHRLVWAIAGSVLATSVVAGGLGGFFAGAGGKPWGAILGFGRLSAPSHPQAVPPVQPEVADDVKPQVSPLPDSQAKAQTGTRRALPVVEEAHPVAKKAGAEKTAPTTAPDKKALAAGGVAPATLAKGVADSASAGRLVTLVVASQPVGADVWINGKGRGRTPLEVKIQSGPAHVVLVLAGYTSVTADVTANEGAKVSKDLVAVAPPMTGDARFRAECTTRGKLPIVVDGKETGILCPFTKLRVEPGVHKIGLFVPALGQVHEKEVTLHPGVRSIVFGD
jgi:serine/threonine-protein kinase